MSTDAYWFRPRNIRDTTPEQWRADAGVRNYRRALLVAIRKGDADRAARHARDMMRNMNFLRRGPVED